MGKHRDDITETELRRLYEKGLSQRQIANVLGCSQSTVQRKMQKHGIEARSRRIYVAEIELHRLHDEEGLLQREIAEILGCSRRTLRNKLRKYGVKTRSRAEAQIIVWGHEHLRRDFDGGKKEKAYLIGFCRGDMHVKMYSKSGQTIEASCTSTRWEQIELVEDLFSPYGYIWKSSDRRGQVVIRAYLNLSFAFLLNLEDNIPDWILADSEAFLAFLGGYTDAEGCINISCGRSRFRLRSYDRNILHQAHAMLLVMGIECPEPQIESPRGYTDKRGRSLSRDYWRLGVYRRDSLQLFFERIGPYLRHAKRIQDLRAAIRNIQSKS